MSSAGDHLILEALRKSTLSHLPDAEWGMLTSEVDRVGGIVNLEGYARDAIAEAVQKAKSFGGDRSAAGRYAANMRWMKYKFYEDEGASAAAAAAPAPPPPPNGPNGPKGEAGRRAARERWKKKNLPTSETSEERQPRRYAEGDAKTRAMVINSLTRETKKLKREVQRAERRGKTGKELSELKAMYANTVRMLEQEKKIDAIARREGR